MDEDNPAAEVNAFAEKAGINYPVMMGNGNRESMAACLPTHFVRRRYGWRGGAETRGALAAATKSRPKSRPF